eukprot:c23325_g1_i1 orf=89-1543(+)
MTGSDKGFRGPPFALQPDVQIPSPAPAYAVINSSSSNNINNTSNHRQGSMGSRNALAARVSVASGSSGSTRGSHHSLPRGPPRVHGGTDDHRRWVYNVTPPPPSADKFVVVSFNILGVDNANKHWRELYWHIPSFIMEWNYRKRRILLELGLWSPDIICLQEVDRFEDLQNDLVQQGYEGVHKGRTGGSTDGCAIFWRTQKFDLLQMESIEYQDSNLRHNVAQLCVLQTRHGEQIRGKGKRSKGMVADNRVVVCNIHVLFNPNRGEIKLGQVRQLLEKAYSLSHEWGGIPVIVAGDFNSVPQSPLYQFLRDAMLDVSQYDRRAISGQVQVPRGVRQTTVERWTSTSQIQVENEEQAVHAEVSIVSADCSDGRSIKSFEWSSEELEAATGSASDNLVKHNLKLESAYASIKGSVETRDTNNEPLVTTYHGNFRGTVDYIWFTGGLVSVKVLEVLPVHILQRTKGLPSKKWGSDHLALACEFAFSK